MRPICRGTRSKYDSKEWTCDICKEVNEPFKLHFFDVPKLACPCGNKYPHDFKFNLRAILVNGHSVVRYVKKQRGPRCTANAYTAAVEIKKCIKAVRRNEDPGQVPELDPDNLWNNVQKEFPHHRVCKMTIPQKVVHMGLMLKRTGVKSRNGKKYYKVSDVSTIKHDDLQTMLNAIANGEPLVAAIRSGKKLRHLKWCQIYKAPSARKHRVKNNKIKTHAVVLIGGGLQNGFLFFYFLNSWGKSFCVRHFLKPRGYYGVGKVRKGDLSRSVVMLASQDKAGTRSFREESGSTPAICEYNKSLVAGPAFASKKSYREEEQEDLNAELDKNDVVEVEDDEYGQEAAEEKNWNQLLDGKSTCQKKEDNANVKEQEAAEEHLAFKEMTLPTARDELIEAKQVDKEQLCNISPALAVLTSASSVNKGCQEFLSLVNKEIKPHKSMSESEGTEGGEEAKKACMAAREESDTTAEVAAEVKVSSEMIDSSSMHENSKLVAAMLQEPEKAIDDVDAQIGIRWQRRDRDHDGKVTPEVVAATAAHHKDNYEVKGP